MPSDGKLGRVYDQENSSFESLANFDDSLTNLTLEYENRILPLDMTATDNDLEHGGIPTQTASDTTTSHETSNVLGKRSTIGSEATSGSSGSSKRRKISDGEHEPHVIAHSSFPDIDALPWPIQWELARAVSRRWSYDQLSRADLRELIKISDSKSKTSLEDAANRVAQLTSACGSPQADGLSEDGLGHLYDAERSASNPWAELQLEHELLSIDPFAGLGCNEDQDWIKEKTNNPDYYGGRVNFCATINARDRSFKLTLEKPYLGTSCRFTRRFGSWSVVRVRIGDSQTLFERGDKLLSYFKRPFIIHSRVFRAFYAKEGSVFLIQTNECTDGTRIWPPDPGPSTSASLSYEQFLNWHNDLTLNRSQVISKWASRFALGLSNSIPGVKVKPERVHFIPDIISPLHDGSPDVPGVMQMTDGCGLANLATFRIIQSKLGWKDTPTAVQCRVNGAKGLLLLHPDYCYNPKEEPEIWIRPSQTKIHYDNPAEPAYYIIDVLRSSHLSTPARLSEETIINLAENGVSTAVFEGLLKTAVQERVGKLLTWGESDGLFSLWINVAREGAVLSARMTRHHAGIARAMGYVRDDPVNVEEQDEDDLVTSQMEAMTEKSKAWWDDPVSGCPSSLEETVLVLLDAGFRPETSRILSLKLREVALKAVRYYTTGNFVIDVPQSCSCFVVPDPTGKLKPGEVHIRSSYRNLVDAEGNLTDLIMGEVLLTRSPCKVPTDVQKARAVFIPELRDYRDVIVVSTQGHEVNGQLLGRHLASMTGGGDFDGDLMQAFWHPDLVKQFKPSSPSFADEPSCVQEGLLKHTVPVTAVLEQLADATHEDAIHILQDHLLYTLKNASYVGKYSTMWSNAVYVRGYDSEEAIRLAYMFCAILDGAKTGVTAKPEKMQADVKKWLGIELPYKLETEEKSKARPSLNTPQRTVRPAKGKAFVLDVLKKVVEQAKAQCIIEIDKTLGRNTWFPRDLDLVRPWEEATKLAEEAIRKGLGEQKAKELEMIKDHVEEMQEKHAKAFQSSDRGPGPKKKKSRSFEDDSAKGADFTKMPIEKRQDILRSLSRQFASKPPGPDQKMYFTSREEVARLRASYAYVLDYEKRSGSSGGRFPFDLAMAELGHIKAKAQGRWKTVSQRFYEVMKISSRAVGGPVTRR
ncbi:hypothetical protein K474DRAFT_1663689 [Panus rudis PR-1116 ss-1]|nr:hypothetical protein K474DRAFT_1663689 [Panus rudis PR-1116 ss-1]